MNPALDRLKEEAGRAADIARHLRGLASLQFREAETYEKVAADLEHAIAELEAGATVGTTPGAPNA